MLGFLYERAVEESEIVPFQHNLILICVFIFVLQGRVRELEDLLDLERDARVRVS